MKTSKGEMNRIKDLIDKKWFYAAAVYLAEENYEDSKIEFETSLITDFFNNDEIVNILQEANNNYDKIINILSYGSIWDEDELLLVFTHLVELILLDKLLNKSNLSFGFNMVTLFDLISDFDIERHKKEYQFVKKSFSKNWKRIDATRILERFIGE